MRSLVPKRLLSVLLVISLLVAYALPAHASAGKSGITFEQVDNSAVSVSPIQQDPLDTATEVTYQDTDIVRVSIVLDRKSTLEMGYSTQSIADNAYAMTYRTSLEAYQDKVESRISAALGKELDVVWNLTLAADIISANVAFGDIPAIMAVSGVENVVIETEYAAAESVSESPDTAISSDMIGASTAWATGYTGAGMRIAVIDTGIDTDHQSFSDEGYAYSLSLLAEAAGMSYEDYVASLDLLDADEIASKLDQLNISYYGATADALYVNSKIAFGFNYVDVDYDITHDNDSQGEHGSHVEGIAAANAYIPNGDGTYSDALTTVGVQGVAPDAQIITMKVFGKGGGAYASDYMVAIEDAIVLGADAINLSLGSSYPGMAYSDTDVYQAIMDMLTESDTVVSISAGNAGYWAESSSNFIGYYAGIGYLYADDVSMDTVGSPGSFTNALTVASVDNNGSFNKYFQVGDSAFVYTESAIYGNSPLATLDLNGTGTVYDYVFVDGIGEEADYEGIDLTGKIVFCSRGTTSFYEKANLAVSLGAAAVIIYNNADGIIGLNLTGYSYSAPVVSILQSYAAAIRAMSTEQTVGDVTYYTGSMTIYGTGKAFYNDSEYYTMSSFSSWGIPGSLTLKPEITAPGGSIYSVDGSDASGSAYELMSGTSMAAPQVAGMAALVMQYIQDKDLTTLTGLSSRTLAQSLLMSTAVPLYDGDSGEYYSVLQQGAGLADVSAAISAGSYILMDESATESAADGKVKAELGDDPDRNGEYSVTFSIYNLTDTEETYLLSADLFTQDLFYWYVDEYFNAGLYMDTWTTGLAYSTVWTVDGVVLTATADSLTGMDFNGDGVVNTDDGQALLDYATGARDSICNADLADLNGDGSINSYDAYLFFSQISTGAAVVPANGSVEITVTLTLTDEQKAYLDAYYTGGAYVEGYIYATAVSSEEGVEGTSHSIPVLAFYGSWTDASMYDSVSWTDYYDGDTSWDYMGTYYSNYVSITYGDGSGTYTFGGNPLFYETYDESRNAISVANGDSFAKAVYSLIRNAVDGKLTITNATTGEVELEYDIGQSYSAFYNANSGSWAYTSSSVNLNFVPSGSEGDEYVISLTMVPEYYQNDDGTVDWDALGDGATLSISFSIDNTAPTVSDISDGILYGDYAADIYITASDNQYIAGAYLFDSTGTQAVWSEAGSQTASGETQTFCLEAGTLESGVYLLQVYDYAMNVSTYRVFVDVQTTDSVESVTLSDTYIRVLKGSTDTLSAVVLPANVSDASVTWSTSDPTVATVSDSGVVTGIAEGTCVITATSTLDPDVSAQCDVEVFIIDKTLNAVVWDEYGEVWWSEFAVSEPGDYTPLTTVSSDAQIWSAAVQDGVLYAQDYSGYFYSVDPDTFGLTEIGASGVDYADMAESYSLGGYLLAVNGPYVLTVDPTTGVYSNVIYMSSSGAYITGITYYATGYNSNYQQYIDYYFLIDQDGNLYFEAFMSYGGTIYYFNGADGYMGNIGASATYYYFNSAYFDFDTGYLFYSAYSGDVSTLYAIDVYYTGECYTLDNFGEGVWPAAALLDLSSYQTTAADGAQAVDLEIVSGETVQMISADSVELMAFSTSANIRSDASAASAQPAAGDNQTNVFTVDVTAQGVQGMDVSFTNGVVEVRYNNEVLRLTGVTINGDYSSKALTDGSVTIGYVSLDGVQEGKVIATLEFEVLTPCADTGITINHKEIGDQAADDGSYITTASSQKTTTHDPIFVPAVEPTCTENGNIAYWYCEDCGKYFADEDCTMELTYEDIVRPATGHDPQAVNAVEPTCTEDGNIAYWYCEDCGKYFADADCTTEITYADTVRPATGHDTLTVNAKEATCTEDGYTGDVVCSICEEILEKGEVIPATGHSWGEWVQTKDPTCTEKGEMTRTCSVCGEVETQEVDMVAHSYVSVVTPATDTEYGYTTHTCSVCGHSYVDSYTDPGSSGKTGDTFSALWVLGLAFSAMGICALVVSRKKWFTV